MAELERNYTAAPPSTTTATSSSDIDSLPSLFGKLGENMMTLLDTKLSLLKVEFKEDASAYARNGALVAVGGIIAAIGFALVNVAIAFFIASIFDSFDPPIRYALGFIITGLLYLIIGGALTYVFLNRLTARSPVPHRSVDEIERDKQWLKNEIQ